MIKPLLLRSKDAIRETRGEFVFATAHCDFHDTHSAAPLDVSTPTPPRHHPHTFRSSVKLLPPTLFLSILSLVQLGAMTKTRGLFKSFVKSGDILSTFRPWRKNGGNFKHSKFKIYTIFCWRKINFKLKRFEKSTIFKIEF
jgi:hypothetical protein